MPLWFRLAIVSNGRGVRLILPLFLLGPVGLILFVLLLPLAILIVALVGIRNRKVLPYFVRGVGILPSLAVTLFLHGRGTGVWVRDGENEVGFWLS